MEPPAAVPLLFLRFLLNFLNKDAFTAAYPERVYQAVQSARLLTVR